jgi:lysophospholipase L1-like esterase
MHEKWKQQKSLVWGGNLTFDEERFGSQYQLMRARFAWSRSWLALAFKDGLHLNAQGYELWASILRPIVDNYGGPEGGGKKP